MQVEHFDNLEQFISSVMSFDPKLRRSSERNSKTFAGTETIDESVEIARHGFDVEKLSIGINKAADTESHQINAVHDVSGAVVDMGAYLEGIPENMVDFPVVHDPKFIDVMVDLGEHCDKRPSLFLNKAIAAASTVDHLENIGFRVRLIVVCATNISIAENLYLTIVVKNYNEPLAIGQIAGCLHPGFFRRLCFLWMEKMFRDHYKRDCPMGYGTNMSSKAQVEKFLKQFNGADAILLANSDLTSTLVGQHFNLYDTNEAIKWAERFTQDKLKELKYA